MRACVWNFTFDIEINKMGNCTSTSAGASQGSPEEVLRRVKALTMDLEAENERLAKELESLGVKVNRKSIIE